MNIEMLDQSHDLQKCCIGYSNIEQSMIKFFIVQLGIRGNN